VKKIMFGTVKHVLRLLAYGGLGVVLTLLVVLVMHLNSRPDLAAWHTVHLDEEFTSDSEVSTFAEYLALEDRLFKQLDEEVYQATPANADDLINRYRAGSLADPGRWARNWNRSYEMPVDDPPAAVLLLHGLSDSPYSLKHLAEKLSGLGVHVLGLRIPGHGTAPSGLVRTDWKDMAAAVHIAVNHLSQQHPNAPLHLVGYSNGAALALNYELDSLVDPSLPGIDRLVLISPEIAVTKLAMFAKTQARLGRLLGLEKLAWNDILPEYDPYKYGSFAVNAGKVSYEITEEIQKQISRLAKSGKLEEIAPILAFSSVVDATVEVTALVDNLFNRLPGDKHELVLFDINRRSGVEPLLRWNPQPMLDALSSHPREQYTLRLVSNKDVVDGQVELKSWQAGEPDATSVPLGLSWPDDLFSLTHVALPFPPGDSLYGGKPASPSPGLQLGRLAYRGERGVLQISADSMLRLRWNPFYSFLESRALEFLQIAHEPEDLIGQP
jgi:alpha-beta hydrolase superfamily lysophospholipase